MIGVGNIGNESTLWDRHLKHVGYFLLYVALGTHDLLQINIGCASDRGLLLQGRESTRLIPTRAYTV
jgi:hypothetical protein